MSYFDTKTGKYRSRFAQLKLERNSWDSHWKELVSYMLPRRGRFIENATNDGSKKHGSIINSTALDALRTIAAGLQGGLTSPSRPWFVLSVPDEGLMEYGPVKEYLHNLRNVMLNIFSKSNFYGAIHGIYKELAGFGVSAMIIDEDFKEVIRCRPMSIGEFYLAQNNKYRVDSLYREFHMTARQMVKAYGKDNVSDNVLNSIKNKAGERYFSIAHLIEPSDDIAADKVDYRSMPYRSVAFEISGDQNRVLKESGYRSIPFVAPRWEPVGNDVYSECPGMDALGDVKQLQKMEEKKLKALDKMVDPPMNADSSLKKSGGTIIPGGVNYTDDPSKSFIPTYQVRPDLQNIAFEIDRVERRVERAFYNDLFKAILAEEKTMTATEISRRFEEKLIMLGPVIERLQAELLDVIIDRALDIMHSFNMVPPAPEEIQGADMRIEYVSLLAQAQKMVGVTSIEQTAAFVTSIAQLKPEALDKFDADEAIDQYGDMVGVPPKIIVSDDEVVKIREARAKEIEKAKMQEEAERRVAAGKTLSETKLGENSALDELLGGMGGG